MHYSENLLMFAALATHGLMLIGAVFAGVIFFVVLKSVYNLAKRIRNV